ncbi:MAG: type II toxin-antitoxin system RelE/ParE family toxin [Thermoleophilia bacterium]|nr:type II toxin-antitoxin system RelE/ParE family toxin [Thermoleophilia bacterium]
MRFVETPIFTEEVRNLLGEEECRALQLALLFRPEQGALIKGSGGIRKIRWGAKGKGKRGGCRIIYYLDKPQAVIYMLFAYPKSAQADLTPTQIKILSKLVKEEFK